MDEPIRIATLNVRGLVSWKQTAKRARLFQFIKNKKLDVCILTETNIKIEHVEKIEKEWNALTNANSLFAPTTEIGSGVAILFGNNHPQPTIRNKKISAPGRCLSFEMDIGSQPHRICAIYAPAQETPRKNFFDRLVIDENSIHPIIMGGDFNHVDNPSLDREGGTYHSRHTIGATQVKLFQYANLLVDPFRLENPTKKEFTHHNNTGTHSRIDKILIPESHLNLHSTSIKAPPDETPKKLDHFMVICKFNLPNTQTTKRGPGVWKFNSRLLKKPEFITQANEVIDDMILTRDDYSDPGEFWECLKSTLKFLAQNFAKNIRKKELQDEKTILDNLASEESNPNPNPRLHTKKVTELKEKLAEIEKIKIDALLLHTKLDYVEHGEKPSSYFYQIIKIRQKNSGIFSLYDKTSGIDPPPKTENPFKILKNIHKYYTNLYSKHAEEISEAAQTTLLNQLDRKLSPDSISKLEAPLTLNELKSALKKMNRGKSPGIDGLSVEFFSQFQDKLLPILLECALHSASMTKLAKTQREAILALIFKQGDRANLANWRPISLLNVDYKIIATVLAERVKEILDQIIGPAQTCGVRERTITTNTTTLRDAIDHATQHQNTTILFTLDQEKAFDRVNHAFLIKVLQKFGFGPNFCNWINTLYTENISYIQNRGNLSNPVKIQRGVRQGCPLSCYLYVCVAETQLQAIIKDKQIIGYPLPWPSTYDQLKVSAYADDNNFFVLWKSHQESLRRLLEKMELYQKASGSKLNYAKSKGLVVGGNPSNQALATEFNSQNPHFPIKLIPIDEGVKMLGIWYHPDPETFHTMNYKPLMEKLRKKTNFARIRGLSVKGKVIILNTMILPKLWYVMTTVPLCTYTGNPTYNINPKPYINAIYDIISDYINPKYASILRETLTLPIKKGGLGIPNIHHKSLALRAKQINQMLPFDCKLPSTKFARYWMANQTYFLKPWTSHLKNYIPPYGTRANYNHGYQSLIDLFHTKKDIFISLEELPSSKKVYTELQKCIERPLGSGSWESRGFPTPAWENSFKALNPNKQQESLWRLRHRRLYNNEAKCSHCLTTNPRAPQEHIFAECTFAKKVWQKTIPIIAKIAPPNRPPNDKHLILGVQGLDKRSTLANTLISATIHRIWRDQTEFFHAKKLSDTTPHTIASLAFKDFKEAISTHFKIHLRNDSLEVFEEKILLPQIASIRDRVLYFEPP